MAFPISVPDMLGFGTTDMPLEPSAYSTKRLCDDLAALLDHLGVQKAVVIGHDWGAFTAGRFALWHPERLLALALLSVPYTPPPTQHMSVHDMVERFPSFGYQIYFASEESAGEIEAHVRNCTFDCSGAPSYVPSSLQFFRLLFRSPSQRTKSWSRMGELQYHILSGQVLDGGLLNDEELDYYVSSFRRGMIGPLSYYRTTKVRFEEERDAALPSKLRANLPVLFMYGTSDVTCPPAAVINSEKFIDQLKVVPISGVGHWVMLETPQMVTEAILQWLRSAVGPRVVTHL
ncbi:Alpha/Beta hydrolase protein [Chiua virens]|nr:Alpha/Beta hydrolase protein [Chiua virens]